MLAIAALAGAYSLRDWRATLGLSVMLLVTSVVVVDGGRRDFFGKYGWIPWAWIALCLAPDFRFTFRSPLDTSVSSASLENIAQVIIYGLIAGLVLSSRRVLVGQAPGHIRKGPLLIWPLIAVSSTMWSPIPLLTLVRALQLLVPIGLTLLMVRLWLLSPDVAGVIWKKTFRLFVQAVTVLVVLGFAAGFWRDRFTWPGFHPGIASLYMGVCLLILIACGRSFLGFWISGYWFRLLLLGAGLYLGESRTVIAALLVAVAVMLWWTGRTRPLARYLGVPYYAIALVLVLVAASPEIMRYLARGETIEGVTSLNGRIPLWGLSIQLVSDASRWFVGFGYGAARVILPTHVEWAGTAHSSWVELLLSIGILGPLLAAVDIFFLLSLASSRRSITPHAPTLSVLAFLLVASIASETLALPGLGFVILAFLHAPVLTQWTSSDWDPGGSHMLAFPADSRTSVPPTFSRRP